MRNSLLIVSFLAFVVGAPAQAGDAAGSSLGGVTANSDASTTPAAAAKTVPVQQAESGENSPPATMPPNPTQGGVPDLRPAAPPQGDSNGTVPAASPSPTTMEPKIRSILNSSSGSTFGPESVTGVGKAQTTAAVSGKVTDLSGTKGLDLSRVLLIKEGEDHKRAEFETGPDGVYTIKKLEPGQWSMTITSPNMLSDSRKLDLSAGEFKTINVMLEDLEAEDVLRITGKRSLIHPEKIGSTTNIDHDTLYEYKTGNDLHELIQSTPGVITDTIGNIIVRGEHNAINYQLDGVFMPEAAGVLQQSSLVTPRSLQSMQVDIGGYQASDGGGPMGAFVRMKSLPIQAKPTFTMGTQGGGPLAGNLYFNTSGALSQDANSVLNKIRFEASGACPATSLGWVPPTKNFTHNNRVDLDVLMKLEYLATERDTIKLTAGINQTYLEVPTSKQSYFAGVRQHQQDRQDFIILSWKHRYKRFFDESNLHILNCFYDETYHSAQVFDPNPEINGGQPLQSIAPNASRSNYVFGTQGNIIKTFRNTHRLEAGFLSELRWAKTDFGGTFYNNDPTLGPSIPVGAIISPFTGNPVGPGNPSFGNNLGHFKGFRMLESAYVQDTWRPTTGWLKRLTVDGGARVDVYHGVFGGTQGVEQVMNTIPGAQPFLSSPFNPQRVTNAQVSGRYGLSYVINPMTVWRCSFSNLFMPPPVDIFSTPPTINAANLINGVYNGTVRSMVATRGKLFDTSIERQIGSRFAFRNNGFWKYLTNYGDSGVIGNSPLYNRQTVAAQVAYGVETRLELKKAKDGYGLNGFLSNTWQIALLRGSKQVTGGIYSILTTPIEAKYPDHDRRESIEAALGWTSRHNWWVYANYNFLTGLQDERDPNIYGPHAFRTPWINTFGLSAGYKVPAKVKQKLAFLPDNFDARFENLTNERFPTNLGSPFQGTRYMLPFRFLIGFSWQLGKQNYKFSQVPPAVQTQAQGQAQSI